jgi:dihydroorotate dehydrogenase (NAD+) catalytic subunit
MRALNTSLSGVRMDSPLVLASGVLGVTASSLRRVALAGAGAVTAKSCSLEPRQGHPAPCILPFDHGMLNAVGLSNPGVSETAKEVASYKQRCATPIIASVFAGSVEQFGEVTAGIATARPDLIEVNVSCPNVESEFGLPFGADFEATGKITRIVKEHAAGIPIAMKLTAQCPSLARMAQVCQDNGADAICAINTVGPGMLIDTEVARPILSNLMGGVSGGAIFPIALRAVWQIYRAVSIPIIGTGGVSTVDQVVQMLMAGATAVGIGSAVYQQGIHLFALLNQGLEDYLGERHLTGSGDLMGRAHG